MKSFYLIKPPMESNSWNFWDIFNNDHAVEIEIGSGNGHFLAQKCANHSNINYIGIELQYKRVEKAIKKAAHLGAPNIRFISLDANEVVSKYIPANSIHHYYYNFPDPWYKRKHHKKRLFTRTFLKNLVKTMRMEGYLTIVTDHEGYLNWMMDILLIERSLSPVFAPPVLNEYPGYFESLYENKWRKEGRKIYYSQWKKIG